MARDRIVDRWAYGGWGSRPYVSAGARRRAAVRHVAALAKQGRKVAPVQIAGRQIARTFWGQAWCENLERYRDFANRLPRGRTYVRNGSVFDLQVAPGKVSALVSGSEIYEIVVTIAPVKPAAWKAIRRECAGKIDSLVELLQGRLSDGVMAIMTRQDGGLFPTPRQITMTCSCPDWATMCKHVAATLYGIGARLDTDPALLFTLRKVDHLDLVGDAGTPGRLAAGAVPPSRRLAGADLSRIFGIDLDPAAARPAGVRRARRTKPVAGAKGRRTRA